MRQTKRHRFRKASGKRRRGVGHATASFECLEDRLLLTAVIELSSLLAVNGGDGTTGFVINGVDAGEYSGYSVSSAGDVNGDGFDDLIIGTLFADANGTTEAGKSYVVFGKAGGFAASLELSSLDGSNGFVINGIDEYDYSGWSVSSAGDVNGDGFDDLIIGAFGADPNSSNFEYDAGESYVVFGKAAGFAASLELSSLDGSNGFVINGVDENSYSGVSVSSAGDINGDGFDDLIIGTHIVESWHYAGGESYVVFGKAGGFAASLELSSLDGSNGFAIIGIDKLFNPFPPLRASVSAAGDVNGDGFDDLIIGVHYADSNGLTSAGESYVVFGKAGGFAASLELSSLDGSNGFVIKGIDEKDQSGYSVSSAGDVNGDGFDDLIIGAKWADPNGTTYAGETYVVFGKASGFGASLELSSLDGSNGFVINGINANDRSGESVSSAGDVNGDGFDDLIIGAAYANPNGNTSAGASYVVYGKAGGFAASLELSALDGSNGFVINGIDAYDYSGYPVSSAGDVNGDGFDDLIIGGSGASPNGIIYAGESYVLFGGDFTGDVSQLGDANANTLTGTGAAEVLIGAQGDDTIIGGGGADVLKGGEGDDVLSVSDLGFLRIVGGNGSDTLQLSGAGLSLDLTTTADNRILGVEQIDISGSGANTLIVGFTDVLNISDESNTLIVGGDADDSLYLSAGWTLTGTETIGGTLHKVFTQNAATLKVAVTVYTVTTTIGLFDPVTSTFFLRNSNTPGPADVTSRFGPPGSGWTPIVGDWDGNGTTTLGLFNPVTSTFFLRNSNTPGPADVTSRFGPPGSGWTPIVGDWDGNGTTTLGLFNPVTSTFFLKNNNSAGPGDLVFRYGPAGAGWTPVVGDWDGDGGDTAGLFDPVSGRFFLKNSNTAGAGDLVFRYGPAGAGWTPVVGDWDGDGDDTAGLFDPVSGRFLLKNSNTAGAGDLVFRYGPAGAGWLPVVGDWDGDLVAPTAGSAASLTVSTSAADPTFLQEVAASRIATAGPDSAKAVTHSPSNRSVSSPLPRSSQTSGDGDRSSERATVFPERDGTFQGAELDGVSKDASPEDRELDVALLELALEWTISEGFDAIL